MWSVTYISPSVLYHQLAGGLESLVERPDFVYKLMASGLATALQAAVELIDLL